MEVKPVEAKTIEVTSVEVAPIQKVEEKVVEEELVVIQQKLIHTGFPRDSIIQDYVDYAYQLGGIEFVALNECENGTRDPHRAGDAGRSIGFCQLHGQRHKEIYQPDFKSDWQKQLNICHTKREQGTRFYGPDRRVQGGRCVDVVKSRFILE